MNFVVNPVVDLIISVVTAFVISAASAIVTVIGSGYVLKPSVYEIAAIFGALAAAKDLRSQLKLPAITNGTGDTQILIKSSLPPSPPAPKP